MPSENLHHVPSSPPRSRRRTDDLGARPSGRYFRAGRDRAEALLGRAWRQQCVRNFPMALQSTYQQWRADLERYEPDDEG